MFIQTQITMDENVMEFLPGQTVLTGPRQDFTSLDEAARSPLARRLFELEGVEVVSLASDSLIITKAEDADWDSLKPAVLGAVVQHFASGDAVIDEDAAAEADAELVDQVKNLIDTRIFPAVSQQGGDIAYDSFKDGVVYLRMEGAAFGMMTGIQNMLRHYMPEVREVRDYRDALPKPGLETEEARIVQEILETRINPSVASHGGHISLVDVQDDTVYIRLEGGCQGCGMANVTLKEGVEVEIKNALPSIAKVLDVTDHAGGTNPYYQPS